MPCQLPAQGPPRSRHSRVSLSANCGTKVPRRRKPDRRHKRSAGHADRLEPLQTLAGRACCHFASHCHPAGVLNSGGERRNVVANQLWLCARSVIGPPQSTPRTSQVAWLQLNLRGRSRGKYCQSPAYPADRALPPSDRPSLPRSLTDLCLLRHVSATWLRPSRATEKTEIPQVVATDCSRLHPRSDWVGCACGSGSVVRSQAAAPSCA